ncbi:MAG TPA: magnesium chelatase domain-containing protein [Fibrobacteria bacterium]|nr:magnesium chelatase domain-containing protein [Fibrobacteria bacterium]HOX52574.1 magnesium chelatase domain-containing protein [Fibrobacteria bacterium]
MVTRGFPEILAELHPFHAAARLNLADLIASRSFKKAAEPVSDRVESAGPFLARATPVTEVENTGPAQHILIHGPAGSGKRSLAKAVQQALQGQIPVMIMEADKECTSDRGVVLWIVRDGKLPKNVPARTPRVRVRSLSSSEKRRLLSIQVQETCSAFGLDAYDFLREDLLNVLLYGGMPESGVLGAVQRLERLCRRRAREQAEGYLPPVDIAWAASVLGPDAQPQLCLAEHLSPGAVHSPLVSSLGGALAQIEAFSTPGKGRTLLTGAGQRAEEAVRVARSRCLAFADQLGMTTEQLRDLDWHVHVSGPEGPKDGISLGWPVLVAMVSHLSGVPVDARYGFTGEITLNGGLRPVGYVDEKFLSCERQGFRRLFMPAANLMDLSDMEPEAIGACEPTPTHDDLGILRGLGLLAAEAD